MTRNPDEMLRLTLADGAVRGLALSAAGLVDTAARLHDATPVAAAALGRALMGTAMMGALLKGEDDSVTVTFDGGGPLGRIVCAADRKSVRGLVGEPHVQRPLRADGKLDVGGVVGAQGRVSVVRDTGLKTPYVGQCALRSGEIAEDLAQYFALSEQTPTLLSLGVLADASGVAQAGGVLLQPLPGCPEEVVAQLELRSPMMADISRELSEQPLDDLMRLWFDGLRPVVLERWTPAYRCDCSRERMERALIAMGREELSRLIEEEPGDTELTCQFCHRAETFTKQDLLRLLNRATRA